MDPDIGDAGQPADGSIVIGPSGWEPRFGAPVWYHFPLHLAPKWCYGRGAKRHFCLSEHPTIVRADTFIATDSLGRGDNAVDNLATVVIRKTAS